jgi:hypothetical protein
MYIRPNRKEKKEGDVKREEGDYVQKERRKVS